MLIILLLSGCTQKKERYWKKKKIEEFFISIPSDYKLGYYSADDSGAHGCISDQNLTIEYVAGSGPVLAIKGKVLKFDTTGDLIVRISSFYSEGDSVLTLQAWDKSARIALVPSQEDHFYGIDMVAKKFSSEQRDTVLKIFSSLSYIPHDSTPTAKYIKAHQK